MSEETNLFKRQNDNKGALLSCDSSALNEYKLKKRMSNDINMLKNKVAFLEERIRILEKLMSQDNNN